METLARSAHIVALAQSQPGDPQLEFLSSTQTWLLRRALAIKDINSLSSFTQNLGVVKRSGYCNLTTEGEDEGKQCFM